MLILGINAYHGDSSACLVDDGRLVCAIEEERIRRIKHWAGLPTESIKWCLEYANIAIKDVDHIAVSRNPSAHLHKKILRVLKNTPRLGFLKSRLQNASKIKDIRTSIAEDLGINPSNIKAKVHNVEHHRAHLASTYFVSPFDKALCVSVDGFGDFLSAMRGKGEGNKIDLFDWVEYPHSLGIFYTAFTQFLGFWKYGDEYKVMGLSAFGEAIYLNEMKKIVRLRDNGLFELDTSFFRHDKEGVDMLWEDGSPVLGRIFSDKLVETFGKPREKEEEMTKHHQDIAASVQAVYEDAFFHMLTDAYQKTGIDKIALAGGCIQNSLANGKIFERTPYKEIYIPPASHDGGTAVGAAFWVWNMTIERSRDFIMKSPYWGPEFSELEIEEILRKKDVKFEKLNDFTLFRRTAKDIADGKIVGWFQGRSEWGPRALGNRSILVDPRRKEMKDILNERIKRRESFRPFAPSVIEDFVSEWFEQSSPVPFMEKVYAIRPERGKFIPAVVHVDGTGRLQTVSKEMNPKYHKLIEEFYRQTKVPVVLNTSFNENEPIVNTPLDAFECFSKANMDVLVMGNYYLTN
ncbi:MAG: carbamoyltransferase C-terminal domain-containing protein [Thermodesulfobacteriota bacterium]